MKRFVIQAVVVDDTIRYNVVDNNSTDEYSVVASFDLHTRAIVEAMLLNEDDNGTAIPPLD